MSENPGGTPPRDDDGSVPPPPGQGQPGGAYPPPAPGQPPASPYGPPPGGGYPPPPGYGQPGQGQPGQGQPGYGAPGGAYPPPSGGYVPPGRPYGQPGAAYGQPYAGAPRPPAVDVGASLSWAFSKFGQNWVAFVVGGIAWAVGIFLVVLLASIAFGGFGALAQNADGGAGALSAIGFGVGGLVLGALTVLLSALWLAAYVRAALKVADGRQVTVGDMFDLSHAGPVFVVGLLMTVAYLIVGWVPLLGPVLLLAVVYLVFFAVHFVVDRGQGAIDAIRSSVTVQSREIGTSILVVLVAWLVSAVGAALCGVGALVGTPVAILISAYAFRRLTGGVVAP
ncbi:hypothetical protein AB6N23_10640 [Cellulomonas sp. 179-A 9B4 NHS]|uniref:hypothetical protein n=1 Tax=Cellulomonas sp. 179-A 9B4 NHS TaxID=3142379 RepID=UPI0039A0BCA7